MQQGRNYEANGALKPEFEYLGVSNILWGHVDASSIQLAKDKIQS